jgi:predicted nucleic acid-binding protein
MAGTLVDANVLIDVLTQDEEWCDWSAAMLVEAMHQGAIFVNPIVFAEVSLGFNRIEELDDALPEKFCRRIELPWAAAFLAGKAFVKYRRRGGQRWSPMPDFYIGAHAAVSGLTLLTRDPKRYRAYFPTVRLMAP